jgi:very-short-patch-repair endonuclease/predicted transcriptional regulator of viral defense system
MHGRKQTRGLDALIAELAERQHGVVARRQLIERGATAEAVDVRRERRRIHPLHPGVYAVGHRVLSQRGRWMAAVLSAGDGAVLSHRSAAALWGIRSGSGGQIHVTTDRKSRSTGPLRRHYSVLAADEIAIVDAIPVTNVPRTIFDLAAEAPPEAVEAALREAEYRRLYDKLSLPDLLVRHPRRRGASSVRAALARLGESPGRIDSDLEERFLPFLDQHGLPRPHFNVWLEVEGERYRVDCLWPAARQIVELDGWDGHRTLTAFREDRARDRRLRAAGYGVTRIAWSQLDTEPLALAADLRKLLDQVPLRPGRR